jgi:hypothetical protein
MVQQRVLETAKGRFLFRVMPPAREFLLREGTDMKYGARHLKRAIERHVVYPLASLLATDQVRLGDVISIDWDGRENALTFLKEAEGAILPVTSSSPDSLTEAAAASGDGREIPFPAAAMAKAEFEPEREVSPAALRRGMPLERSPHARK